MIPDFMFRLNRRFFGSRYVGIGKRYPPLSTLGYNAGAGPIRRRTAVFDYAAKLLENPAERIPGHLCPSSGYRMANDFNRRFYIKKPLIRCAPFRTPRRTLKRTAPWTVNLRRLRFWKYRVGHRAAFQGGD